MLSANDSIVAVITFLFLSGTLITMSKAVKTDRQTPIATGLETKVSVSLSQVRTDRSTEMQSSGGIN